MAINRTRRRGETRRKQTAGDYQISDNYERATSLRSLASHPSRALVAIKLYRLEINAQLCSQIYFRQNGNCLTSPILSRTLIGWTPSYELSLSACRMQFLHFTRVYICLTWYQRRRIIRPSELMIILIKRRLRRFFNISTLSIVDYSYLCNF